LIPYYKGVFGKCLTHPFSFITLFHEASISKLVTQTYVTLREMVMLHMYNA